VSEFTILANNLSVFKTKLRGIVRNKGIKAKNRGISIIFLLSLTEDQIRTVPAITKIGIKSA